MGGFLLDFLTPVIPACIWTVSTSLPAVWSPVSVLDLQEFMTRNYAEQRSRMLLVGGGTSLPESQTDLRIELGGLSRVIDYPHRDLTITVEAGIRWAILQQTLREQGQQLPIDVPQAEQATLGGAIACNVSGPGRFGYGTFRDFVIGISAIDGRGRLFSAGGRVVKNVAGYDLCKLLIGSRGELAAITQVTLKVRPLAQAQRLVVAEFADLQALALALDQLSRSATRPIAQEVINARAAADCPGLSSAPPWTLLVGYAGTAREVDWQVTAVLQELAQCNPVAARSLSSEAGTAIWDWLTEFVVQPAGSVWRGSVLPSTFHRFPVEQVEGLAVRWHAGNGLFDVLIPEAEAFLPQLTALLEYVDQSGGQLCCLQASGSPVSTVTAGEPTAAERLTRQIKATLDPGGLFCGPNPAN